MIVAGAELVLVGGLAASIAASVRPTVVVGIFGAVAAAFLAATAQPGLRPWPGVDAIAALALSFLSLVPGAIFFIELRARSGRPCEQLPTFGMSLLWILVGPALLVICRRVLLTSPKLRPVVAIAILHLAAWLLGAANTAMCTATI
jgi:hypothetical protein